MSTVTHKVTFRAEGGGLTRGFGVIKGTADDQVKVPTGVAQRPEGVVSETVANAGDAVVLVQFGECVAIAGGAVARGDRVKMDANGKWVTSAAEDVESGGIARSTAAADGDEFVIFFTPAHKRS